MSDTPFDFTPFIPGDKALESSALPDKSVKLVGLSAGLQGSLSAITMDTISQHMAVINSYYSNLIEGNPTLPHEVRAAQQGEFSEAPAERDLQMESLAHIQVQHWLREHSPSLDRLFSTDFIREIHARFYEQIPESLWWVEDPESGSRDKVVPGEWRHRAVRVGRHVPPDHKDLDLLMQRFCEIYSGPQFRGDRRVIAIMAAHHRFAWIHPFLDGNGRVGRLVTDAALSAAGLESYGVWCLSRGLARMAKDYKTLLAGADQARQGDYDGRGLLTEKGLMTFCDYMLDRAIDQAGYIQGLFELGKMRERINSYLLARLDGRVSGVEDRLHERAGLVLYSAFLQGELSRSEAMELTGMTERTGRRLLKQLREEGLLSETSHRSPLRWQIPQHAEPWYLPQLAPGY